MLFFCYSVDAVLLLLYSSGVMRSLFVSTDYKVILCVVTGRNMNLLVFAGWDHIPSAIVRATLMSLGVTTVVL